MKYGKFFILLIIPFVFCSCIVYNNDFSYSGDNYIFSSDNIQLTNTEGLFTEDLADILLTSYGSKYKADLYITLDKYQKISGLDTTLIDESNILDLKIYSYTIDKKGKWIDTQLIYNNCSNNHIKTNVSCNGIHVVITSETTLISFHYAAKIGNIQIYDTDNKPLF